LTTQPVVRVTDSGDNTVTSFTGDVVASIASGTGTLSGNTVAAVAGVATFTNLVITGTAGNFTLTFTSAPLTAVTSSSFALAAVISVAAIAGVTAPVTGATPVTTTTAGTGYTGVVTWASSSGALVGNFAGATIYTATITLTATSGYTLTGVSENFFTVAGATTDTNPANSGVITAVFPRTLGNCDGSTFTCQVGDTGPGGGKIFYVASGATPTFPSPGSACNTNGADGISTCKYLEAAPNTWSGGSADPTLMWSTGANQTKAVTGADGTEEGTGYQNSLDIVAQNGAYNAASNNYAAGAARAYTGGSKNDWFLPSQDELTELYLQRATVGGFVVDTTGYWSSSENSEDQAWMQYFDRNVRSRLSKGFIPRYVRPIRAFGAP
jgi:hypothetical protein